MVRTQCLILRISSTARGRARDHDHLYDHGDRRGDGDRCLRRGERTVRVEDDLVQSRHPADPGRQVLPVPRSRRQAAQREAAARQPSRRARRRRRRAARRSCPASSTRASSTSGSPPTTPRSGCRRPRAARRSRPPRSPGSRPGSSRGPSIKGTGRSSPPVRPDAPAGQESPAGAATRSTASSSPGSRPRASRRRPRPTRSP